MFLYCFSTHKMKMSDEQKPEPIHIDILDKMAALITAAFGLVAALAWNDAVKAIFKEVFGAPDAVGPMLVYAILVTNVAVILTLAVARATSKAKSGIRRIFQCEICKFKSQRESDVMEHTLKEHTASQEKFLAK